MVGFLLVFFFLSGITCYFVMHRPLGGFKRVLRFWCRTVASSLPPSG